MGQNARQQTNPELDHIRDTLTDLVHSVGEMGSNIKSLDNRLDSFQQETLKRFEHQDKRFDQQDKRFDQQDKRFDQQDKRFDRLETRFDQLEMLIRQLLPNASN